MDIIKGINTYLSVRDAINLLTLEKPNEVKFFEDLPTEIQEYNLFKATRKIESLNLNPCRRHPFLSFPLCRQLEVPFEVLLCCALEAFTMATKTIDEVDNSDVTTSFKNGIVSESEKTASVSYSQDVVEKMVDMPFDSLEAYNLLKEWLKPGGERIFRIR